MTVYDCDRFCDECSVMNCEERTEEFLVSEYIKTLIPITDFSSLKKGDRIFNRTSLSINYIDTFDHLENWDDGREIIFYENNTGELWWGETNDYWYFNK